MRRGLVAVITCLIALPALAAAPDANSARAFVQGLYKHYPQKGQGPVFAPTDTDAAKVFDPGMVKAFRDDTRLAGGEVGFIDSDPICDCQDDDGLRSAIQSVTMTGAASADAVVKLSFPNDKPIIQTLHLAVVKGAWRIHDITTPDEKSFRADLLKANAAAAHRH